MLLCDEPTAACDLQTDRQIHETLLHGFLALTISKAIFVLVVRFLVVERWEFPMQVTHFGNKHREEDIFAISGLDKVGGISAVEDVGVVARMAVMVGVRE